MTSRGLPGFLRRSRRWNDFDDDDGADDGDDDDDVEDESNDDKDEHSLDGNNDEIDGPQIGAVLDPSPLTESSAQEDVGYGITDITTAFGTTSVKERDDKDSDDQNGALTDSNHSNNNNNNDYHHNPRNSLDNQSMSTLGDSDPTLPMTPHASRASSNVSSQDNNETTLPVTSSRRVPNYREINFEKILASPVVKLSELRKVGWNGIPPQYRGITWKLLLGYVPTNASRRQQTIERKRSEYRDAIRQHYNIDDNSRTLQEQETLRQVLVDVPRTAPDVPLFRNEKIKRSLTRLLYIWAMRHPASSYVQGINDLATPLFAVFLADYYEGEDVLDGSVMVVLGEERLDEVEADVYWCLTNILAGIQDHYTADQPGVQRMVMRLQELVNRIDGDLCDYIESVGIQFMQFAFKWMNCLLLREFNLKCVIRLWDTYISEDGNGFEDFHVYVCAAFLCQFSSQLQSMTFDELFQFMQEVPTDDWGETEIEMLLSQAYVLSTLFGGSDAHLTSNSRTPTAMM